MKLQKTKKEISKDTLKEETLVKKIIDSFLWYQVEESDMIPFNITIISTLLIINVALPIIELDIKNDLDIKNIHQYYLRKRKYQNTNTIQNFKCMLYN